MHRSKQAFTLVELIVVITILAILGTIGFVSLSGLQLLAKDATRSSDINNITKTIELFSTREGRFPVVTDGVDITFSGSTIWTQGSYGVDSWKDSKIMSEVPVDPLTGTRYTYSLTQSTGEYQVGGIFQSSSSASTFPLINSAYAAELIEFEVSMVRGNYNGKFIAYSRSVSPTLKNFYVLGVPSILLSDISYTTLDQIHTNNTFVLRGTKTYPATFSGTVDLSGVGWAFAPDQQLDQSGSLLPVYVIYQGDSNDLSTGTGKTDLITNLLDYYDNTTIASTQSFQELAYLNAADSITAIEIANSYMSGYGIGGLGTEFSGLSTTSTDGLAGNSPILALTGTASLTLEAGVDSYSELGATASDVEDGDLTGNVVIGGDSVDDNVIGTYNVTYNVVDSGGNSATQLTRIVDVISPFPILALSSSKNINTDLISSGRSYADGIAYRVIAPADSASSVTRYSGSDTMSNGIEDGDEVLLINLRGSSSDYTDVGSYEIKTVSSITADTLTFTSAISTSFDGTTPSNQYVVIQRVPVYASVTLSSGGTLTAGAWDALATTPSGSAGYTTGVLAFKSPGDIVVEAGASIDVSGLGYTGGAGGNTGQKGQSYNPSSNTYAGAGNGGDVYWCNSGGGGGSASHSYGVSNLTKLFYGPGGGGGARGDGPQGSATAGNGGRGGGIIFIESGADMTVTGQISASAGDPTPYGNLYCSQPDNNWRWINGGPGGAGAGGSVFLQAVNLDVGSSNVDATLTGTDGRIALYYSSAGSLSGTTIPASSDYTY